MLDAKLSSGLSVRMTEVFGTRWTSQYGDTLPDTWRRALADMSGADIGQGLIACLKEAREWPPSLPEFRRMCRPARRENEAAYHAPPERLLPHKLSDEERAKGREHIAALRSGLKS